MSGNLARNRTLSLTQILSMRLRFTEVWGIRFFSSKPCVDSWTRVAA